MLQLRRVFFSVSRHDLLALNDNIDIIQVHYALSSSSVFSRVDSLTESQQLYQTIWNFFERFRGDQELCILLNWWNK